MLPQKDLKKIENKTKEFFEKMGFLIEIENIQQEQETVFVDLKTEEPRVLIGRNGEVLTEIKKLLKAILRREIEQPFFVNLDINDYKKKKIEYLKETAKNLADRVSLTKKEKVLESMPPDERRIVHLELAERDDIVTQSIGEEPERKVIIKPYP